jgi:hypothetical protein
MCGFANEGEFHYECLNLQGNQIRNPKSVTILVTDIKKTSFQENGRHLKNYLPKILLVASLIVIFFAGVMGTNFFYFVHQSTDSVQIAKSNPASEILISANSEINMLPKNPRAPNYIGCLGSANGNYLLIKCPTVYGYIYQTIVDIPSGLVSKFQSTIFSFRDFSVIENVNSILIDYQKKSYTASFFTH